MEALNLVVNKLNDIVWGWGIPVAGEVIPFVVIALLGTGVFLAFRLRLIQVRKLAHGFGVTSGKYDDPNEPGDVSHFQALTTALSATVGIGNIAGVAMAIHWGGPGALFWMWVTAFLGMGVKYTEVTLSQKYRQIEKPDRDPTAWEGSVSGGPMYYIERGLRPKWKPMAMFFAGALMFTSFLTGNGVQANTVADAVQTQFGVPVWLTGLVTASLVAAVILGGISRIGKVTGILARHGRHLRGRCPFDPGPASGRAGGHLWPDFPRSLQPQRRGRRHRNRRSAGHPDVGRAPRFVFE